MISQKYLNFGSKTFSILWKRYKSKRTTKKLNSIIRYKIMFIIMKKIPSFFNFVLIHWNNYIKI